MNIIGATTEVATLKEALSKAEDNVAMEHTEREKQEARVEEVRQELNALVKKQLEENKGNRNPVHMSYRG